MCLARVKVVNVKSKKGYLVTFSFSSKRAQCCMSNGDNISYSCVMELDGL